jgi:hypothetical protein
MLAMFNQCKMNNITANNKPRVSSAKSVGFRAGPELRDELERLAGRLSRPGAHVTISDILRDGVTAFWPQIRTYIRAQSRTGLIRPRTYASIVSAGTKAHLRGLTPADIRGALSAALSAKTRAAIARRTT